MTYVKIGDRQLEASVFGRTADRDWDGRESKAITCALTYQEACALFTEDAVWSIVYQEPEYLDENGDTVTPEPVEYDNSAYSVAGPVTDNRDGTVTVKMGKITDGEALAELKEALSV